MATTAASPSAAATQPGPLSPKLLVQAIGAGARQGRKALCLTQADVAEVVNIASEVYGRLERGLMMPSVPTLRSLCLALAIPADVLLLLPNATEMIPAATSLQLSGDIASSPHLRRLLRRARQLDDGGLRLLALFARVLVAARQQTRR